VAALVVLPKVDADVRGRQQQAGMQIDSLQLNRPEVPRKPKKPKPAATTTTLQATTTTLQATTGPVPTARA